MCVSIGIGGGMSSGCCYCVSIDVCYNVSNCGGDASGTGGEC